MYRRAVDAYEATRAGVRTMLERDASLPRDLADLVLQFTLESDDE